MVALAARTARLSTPWNRSSLAVSAKLRITVGIITAHGYASQGTYVRIDICHARHRLSGMAAADKPLVWLRGEVKTPPFSAAARLEAGTLLRRLQGGEKLSMPHSRPMPAIGPRCQELRVVDEK